MIFVSNWPARPTNGSPCAILIRAGRFADEHQFGVDVADAENRLGAGGGEMRAKAANRHPLAQGREACAFVVRRTARGRIVRRRRCPVQMIEGLTIVRRDGRSKIVRRRRGPVQTIDGLAVRARWTVACVADAFERADCRIDCFGELAHEVASLWRVAFRLVIPIRRSAERDLAIGMDVFSSPEPLIAIERSFAVYATQDDKR